MSIIIERKQTFLLKDIMRPSASVLFQREIFVLSHETGYYSTTDGR